MQLKLYNTASQRIQSFIPLEDGKITLYVCGITPYDASHIGHAFVFTIFDTLTRFLRWQGFDVTYVQNITDVDDDMLKKSHELDENWQSLGDRVVSELLSDFTFLNIALPTYMPKASSVIDTIIEINKALITKKYAYVVNGTVYFDTKSYNKYGSFSKLSYDEMVTISSQRGNKITDLQKKNPLDFVLWQSCGYAQDRNDDPSWESPWGRGRPGWHIECSAMSMNFLGKQIDIHGGGSDLIFPHHESEIAQSESYTNIHPFVQFWMHCGMVLYKGEKMSKSIGNLLFVADLKKKYTANAIRWLLLSNHYQASWEYKEKDLGAAQKIVDGIERSIASATHAPQVKLPEKFVSCLSNDFNTPAALDILSTTGSAQEKKAMFSILGFNTV